MEYSQNKKKQIKNQIAILTLDRPEKYHSFVKEMALDLQIKLDECKNDPELIKLFN